MSNTLLPSLLVASLIFLSKTAYSQESYLFEGESASTVVSKGSKKPNAVSETFSPYRFHKKLPLTYHGYAIEVITSKYPLDRDHPVFRQFGNVHYDKLQEGGYSYVVKAEFSSDKAALHFLKTIIVHKAPEARLFFYKDGIRKIIRE
jgi:hypothetical protein